MFTGLIEDIGTVRHVRPQGAGWALTIATSIPLQDVKLGDSIAVDGACLTAESFDDGAFVVVAGRESLERTTLGNVRVGRKVHLERALRLGDRLDGHLVQGHVDGVGRVVSSVDQRETWVLWISAPTELLPLIASKGSITINGVSLTVNEIQKDRFRLNIVPHTTRSTRLAELRAGDSVNIEIDVLARYVQRLLGRDEGPDLLQTLRTHGY